MEGEQTPGQLRAMEGEQTPRQLRAMEINLDSIPELSKLYRILDSKLEKTRLERADNIHMVPLYKGRAETGSQEEIFDHIVRAPVNAKGYWCFTRLFYNENGTAIRKVPGDRGNWILRDTTIKDGGDGEKWCIQRLNYNNTHKFSMKQYSLGGKNDQPKYAICQISHRTAPTQVAGRDSHPPGVQGDLLGSQVVLPDNSTHQGGTVGEPNEAHPPSMTYPPPQNYYGYASPNKRKRYDIEDPSGTKWPIEDEKIAEILMMYEEFLRHHQSTLLLRYPSDGSQWSTKDGKIIEFLKWFKYAKDQSTREIPQSNAAPPYIRIEDNPSTSRVQASPHGAAGTSNENAKHQVPNLSHQSYKPTQEGLRANNQDYQRSVIPKTTLHPEPELDLQPNLSLFERHVQQYQYDESFNIGIEGNQPGLQFPEPRHVEAGIVNDFDILQDQDLSQEPYGMANQWNAHVIDPFYPPDESSTHYNQGFSIDDVNTSKPDLDG